MNNLKQLKSEKNKSGLQIYTRDDAIRMIAFKNPQNKSIPKLNLAPYW